MGRPAPDQEAVNEHFRGVFREAGDLYRHPASQLARFESVNRHCGFRRRHVLDVGCGTGDFAAFLAGRGVYPLSYHGVDPVPDFVRAADARTLPAVWGRFPVHFEADDYLAVPRHGFDVVVAVGVVEHNFGMDPAAGTDFAIDFFLKMCRDARWQAACTFCKPRGRAAPFENPVDAGVVWRALHAEGFHRILVDDTYAPHVYTVVVTKGRTEFEDLRGRSPTNGRADDDGRNPGQDPGHPGPHPPG